MLTILLVLSPLIMLIMYFVTYNIIIIIDKYIVKVKDEDIERNSVLRKMYSLFWPITLPVIIILLTLICIEKMIKKEFTPDTLIISVVLYFIILFIILIITTL